jgi:hypothetical protein
VQEHGIHLPLPPLPLLPLGDGAVGNADDEQRRSARCAFYRIAIAEFRKCSRADHVVRR